MHREGYETEVAQPVDHSPGSSTDEYHPGVGPPVGHGPGSSSDPPQGAAPRMCDMCHRIEADPTLLCTHCGDQMCSITCAYDHMRMMMDNNDPLHNPPQENQEDGHQVFMMASVRDRVAMLEQRKEKPESPQHRPAPKVKAHKGGLYTRVQTKIALFSKNPDVVVGYFLLDSACARTVGGEPWKESMIVLCDKYGIEYQLVDENEPFRFGPGKRIYSKYALLLPVVWGQHTVVVRISIVDKDVPRLLSRPAMGSLSMVLDLGRNVVTIGALQDTEVPLMSISTGHVAVSVLGSEEKRPRPTPEAFGICKAGRECAIADEALDAQVVTRLENAQFFTSLNSDSESEDSDLEDDGVESSKGESLFRGVPCANSNLLSGDSSDDSGGFEVHYACESSDDDDDGLGVTVADIRNIVRKTRARAEPFFKECSPGWRARAKGVLPPQHTKSSPASPHKDDGGQLHDGWSHGGGRVVDPTADHDGAKRKVAGSISLCHRDVGKAPQGPPSERLPRMEVVPAKCPERGLESRGCASPLTSGEVHFEYLADV